MDPTKIVVLGAGPGPIRGIIDELTKDGQVLEIKTRGDFLGDVQVLPRRVPEEHTWDCKRGKTGAAAIKRASKKAKRRK